MTEEQTCQNWLNTAFRRTYDALPSKDTLRSVSKHALYYAPRIALLYSTAALGTTGVIEGLDVAWKLATEQSLENYNFYGRIPALITSELAVAVAAIGTIVLGEKREERLKKTSEYNEMHDGIARVMCAVPMCVTGLYLPRILNHTFN